MLETKSKFRDVMSRRNKLREQVQQGSQSLPDIEPGFEELSENIFDSFYNCTPPEAKSKIAERIHGHDSFKRMRKFSVKDSLNSTFATMAINEKIMNGEIPVSEKPQPQNQKNNFDHLDSVPQFDDEVGGGNNFSDMMKQLADETGEELEDYKEGRDELETEAQIAFAIQDALDEAEEKAQEVKMLAQALGYGTGMSEWSEVPEGDRERIAEKLKNDYILKRILELAGRMFLTMDANKRSSYTHGRDEIIGVEQGNDLTRLLPSELVKAKHPGLKKEFYRGYLERGLLQYEMRAEEKKKKGPFIILEDQSGSMSGTPDQWAKALVMATWRICKKEKREVIWIPFDSSVGKEYKFDSKMTLDKLMNFFRAFMGGGTDFQKPLDKAAEICETEEDCDIIIITDGDAPVDNTWLEEFKRKQEKNGFTVLGVQVGGYNSNSLDMICDKQARVNTRTNNDAEVLQWVTTQNTKK